MARTQIPALLAANKLPAAGLSSSTFLNRDDTIDARVRFDSVPRKLDLSDAAFRIGVMMETLEDTQVTRCKVRLVMYYDADEGIESPDWRKRGLAAAATHWYNWTTKDAAKMALVMADIMERVAGAGRRPRQFLIQIFWSPSQQPPRRRNRTRF